VYAAAVILPEEPRIAGLNDSKKLTAKRREALFEQIVEHAVSFCIAEASVEEIDTLNILQASLLAMRRAVAGLGVVPNIVLTDGNQDPGFGLPSREIIGGDGVSASIAAASILAKVARDRTMLELDTQYPAYQFAKHKGYGTKLHYEMLELYEASPVHRRTFLRKWEAGRAK
jgi:ribonuclease HII